MNFIDSVRQLSDSTFVEESSLNSSSHTQSTCLCLPHQEEVEWSSDGFVVPDSRQVFAFRVTEYSYYRSNKPESQCNKSATSQYPQSRLASTRIIHRPYSNPIANQGTDLDLSWGRRDSCFIFVMPRFPLFRGDVFQRVIIICDPYVGPAHAYNRSFRRPPIHIGECTGHDRVGIVSRCCRGSLVLLLVGGLRFRRVKTALRDRC
jgi:hypothetical protein